MASLAAISLAAAPQRALAQGAAPATSSALPAIRTLSSATAKSAELLGAVSQARALPNGRVLVNDNFGRRVLMFEPGLGSFKVIADTTPATANAYSSRAAGLIAYKGDSTLFVDPQSLSMLVIDPTGNVTRVMSVPRPNEVISLIGGPNGTPGFDAQGRLVYRGMPQFRMAAPTPGANGPQFQMPQLPESLAVVRVALDTRKVDTVGHVKIPRQNINVNRGTDGRMSVTTRLNPLQVEDDWAVASDGRVALVRGQDFRVDYVDGEGKVAASHKIPHDWIRLTDSAKVAFIDSAKTALEAQRQRAMQVMQSGGGAAALAGMAGAAGLAGFEAMAAGAAAAGAGDRMRVMEFRMGGGDAPPARGAAPGATAGGAPSQTTLQIPPLNFVDPSELPDYAPPFGAGATKADMDGNLWVRTNTVYNGGSVYDVINAQGKLTDRVLLPAGRVIAGFGPGVVYMGFREGPGGVRLEMAPMRTATP
ncbi:MAG: hypothetical protein FJ202_00475 [Gemmatimonadetes bacterium]|nr:hypothetical protein [Gemmatimonadota bacterium]